jgi:hypothetical protein
MSLSLQRTVRQERGSFFVDGIGDSKSSDVQYALEGVRMRRFRSMELTAGMAVLRGFNRDFRSDATSVSAILRARVPLVGN